MILEKWQFSPEQVEAVNRHHDPDALERDELTALVALSNGLVISMGIGVGADGLATELHSKGLKRFAIGSMELQLCMADLVMEMEGAGEILDL